MTAPADLPAGHGQIAYEAYVKHVGGVSVRGEKLPPWHEQRLELREAWDAAARAVADYLGQIP